MEEDGMDHEWNRIEGAMETLTAQVFTKKRIGFSNKDNLLP